ncbi:hypothetical protein BZK31_01205 [Pseudomonas floridensis]|uniref:Type IV secretion protein Rhs n=1 Tax=Pseudomonas floridensis TaxID=1958950 RepID=A0A1X0NCX4_9PSED|nr:type VI secretion system tip protein TssI/VgrG [Pseudomonas floridensis]ORC62284.1 hypothetical protein BZK31_01205 [Pseudomonas floridensis]
MCNDPQLPITLAIADCQMDLHVISFTGLDALNAVYRFDIDLIGTAAALDTAGLVGRGAFLSFGTPDQGVHGMIQHAIEVYAGARFRHYRLVLMPAVQKLARPSRRSAYHDMSVPQLIEHLLERHDLQAGTYRFEHMTGVYPRRPVRVQYDESDLHLLQRLCEEEGIHFRFEHAPDRHALVFSDDPASFPERKLPIHFDCERAPQNLLPALTHLAEHRSIHIDRPGRTWHAGQPNRFNIPKQSATPTTDAINESLEAPVGQHSADRQVAYRQQRSARHLERLRCESRHFYGSSTQPGLRSGEILQVLDHPEPLLNDQWLLIEVRHAGRQLQTLEGVDPHDIAAIIQALPEQELPTVDLAADEGYTNRLAAIPWSMPFRPSLKHFKRTVRGLHRATLMPTTLNIDADESLSAYRAIRFDWQDALAQTLERWPLAHVACSDANPVGQLQAGARVAVGHLNNDPDRPVICGALHKTGSTPETRVLLEGIAAQSPIYVHLRDGQRLRFESDRHLMIRGEQIELHLTPTSISVLGNATPKAFSPADLDENATNMSDLRLTTLPGLQGEPLTGRIWYIVRMREPGLQHLARLEPEHFLFEGTTDGRGYLGLSTAQRRRLIREYQSTPRHLWLIHPGECLALHTYFQQNWTPQQRQALILSSP